MPADPLESLPAEFTLALRPRWSICGRDRETARAADDMTAISASDGRLRRSLTLTPCGRLCRFPN